MRGPSAVGDGGRRQRRQREYGDRRAARTRGENAIARVGGVQVAETKDKVTRHRPTWTAAVCGVVDEMDDTRKAKCVIPGGRRGPLVSILMLVVMAPTTRPQQYQQMPAPEQGRPPFSSAPQGPPESSRVLGRRFPALSAPRMPRPTRVHVGVVSPRESSSVFKHHSGSGSGGGGSPIRTGRHRAPRQARVRGRSSSTDVPIGTPDPVGSGSRRTLAGDGGAVELAAAAGVVVERRTQARATGQRD